MAFLRNPVYFPDLLSEQKKPYSTVGVLYSWIQKALRKQDPQAYFVADLMVKNGYTSALLKRLKVAVSEDHAGNLLLPYIADGYFQNIKALLADLKTAPVESQASYLVQIRAAVRRCITAILISPKTRILNSLLARVRKQLWEEKDASTLPMTSAEALTQFSSNMANRSYLEELRLVMIILIWANRTDIKALWSVLLSRANDNHVKTCINILNRWWLRDDVSAPLMLAHALMLLHSEGLSDHPSVKFQQISDVEDSITAAESKVDVAFDLGPDHAPAIPDYALDKHTAQGRQMGRGVDQFFDEGAQVANKLFDDPFESDTKRWYQELEQAHRQDKSLPRAKSADVMDHIKKRWSLALGYDDAAGNDNNSSSNISSIQPEDHKMKSKKRKSPEKVNDDNQQGPPVKRQKNIQPVLPMPVCQKITSPNKAYTHRDGQGSVLKGPFAQGNERFDHNFSNYQRMVQLGAALGLHPAVLEPSVRIIDEQRYVQWRDVGQDITDADVEMKDSALAQNVPVIKRNVHVWQLSQWLKHHHHQLDPELTRHAVSHMYLRYLLKIGDTGPWNMLVELEQASSSGEPKEVKVKAVWGIDLEDRRNKDPTDFKQTPRWRALILKPQGMSKEEHAFWKKACEEFVPPSLDIIAAFGDAEILERAKQFMSCL